MMLSVVDSSTLIAGLISAITVALIGTYVANKRLKLMGPTELAHLEAQRQSIVAEAEDRATGRALEALKLALDVTERERDRAMGELAEARKEMVVMRERLTKLERLVDRRFLNVEGTTKRRDEDD